MRLSCFGCENNNGRPRSLVSRVRTTAGTRQNNGLKHSKTARRQLGRRHLLFGEYLRSWTNLNINYQR